MSQAAVYQPPLSDTARLLGHLGLVPFVLGAALVWVVNAEAHPYATLALSAFAAVVVSFLGGIYWGLGFRLSAPPASLFVWGIVPSLVAWVAVMMPASAGLVVHGVMLLVCYAVDRRIYPTQGLAHWLTLRFRLSAVAALSCFLGAAGT
ncbi:MAG: DUF3429 domain-containing protein [Betaproteobacteria bacterium]|nr:DUF3429 domain-containing protein [Betaproteobacteria bacterium]